jgi:transposase
MAYSADYRKVAIVFKQAGHTFKELKDVFKITPQTYYQWIEILETSGHASVKLTLTR